MLSSIAEFMDLQFRGFFVHHAEPGLIAEISPEMLEQLREDALRGILALPLVILGSFAALNWLGSFVGANPMEAVPAIVVWAIVLSCTIPALPATLRGPLDREIKFRRKHGKWRWER
jgi:hypothetical protein